MPTRTTWPIVGALLICATWIGAPALPRLTSATSIAGLAWQWWVFAMLMVAAWMFADACIRFAVTHVFVATVALAGAAATIAAALLELPLLSDASIALAAAALGTLLARSVQALWWTPILAIAVSASDIWSVFAPQGVTRAIVEEGGRSLNVLTIALPIPGLPLHLQQYGALLGATDVLFMAFYITCALRFGLHVRALAFLLPTAIVASTWLSLTYLDGRAFPALPAISLVYVAVCAPTLVAQSARRPA